MKLQSLGWLLLLVACAFARPRDLSGDAEAMANERTRRDIELHDWMNEEQKQIIHNLDTSGASPAEIKAKIIEFFGQLPGDKKKEWEAKYKDDCAAWIKEVATEEELNELKELHKSNEIAKMLAKIEEYKGRLNADVRGSVELWQDTCQSLWNVGSQRSRREIHYKEHLHWMTEEQLKEVEKMVAEGATPDQLHAKVKECFEKLPEAQQNELKQKFKDHCVAWIKEVATEEQMNELKQLHEAGDTATLDEKLAVYFKKLPEEKQQKYEKIRKICDEVWQVKRGKREVDVDALMDRHLPWLTEAQRTELKNMKQSGESTENMQKKLMSYLQGMSEEARKAAIGKTKNSCYSWLKEITTEEERKELFSLHHKDHTACHEKVREYIKRLEPEKQEQIKKDLEVCEKIWAGTHGHHHGHKGHQHRHNRDVSEHKHELKHYYETYLQWLKEDQKKELAEMREAGKPKQELIAKIMEYYSEADGAVKESAKQNLQDACKHLVRTVVGQENADKLKQMKSEGVTDAELEQEFEKMLKAGNDEHKNQLAKEYGEHCKLVFSAARAKRENQFRKTLRDPLQHALDTHLRWLNDVQKDELREMRKQGKTKMEMQEKVMEWYKNAEGETKINAKERMMAGCKELTSNLIGEEATKKIEQMKSEGKSKQELAAEMEKIIDSMEEGESKQLAKEYFPACKVIFEVGRKKRHIPKFHTLRDELEHSLKTVLSWLTMEQKDELRNMEKEGKPKQELHQKVIQWYQAASGETKEKATQAFKDGCRLMLITVFGEDKVNELKKQETEGVPVNELSAKIDNMAREVQDEHHKKMLEEFGPTCKQVYGAATARFKRHGSIDTLEHHFQSNLKWLTDAQKEELKGMKEAGKPKQEIRLKVKSYYEALPADKKPEAEEIMRGGCRKMMAHILGEENARKIKDMKHSGSSHDEIEAEIKKMMAEVSSDEHKQLFKDYAPACKHLFKVEAMRQRL